ncbi:hypothetical protein MKW98_030362 [Papaver atlanticum]|uniref:Uncharacterized protein n=1 Tax=Papaver atlanticum TaxID=357466 RepID=A0AAD4TFU2_9MAGN|nr:hypothetical protein MKW98_030362 [Papaver atlanticum]
MFLTPPDSTVKLRSRISHSLTITAKYPPSFSQNLTQKLEDGTVFVWLTHLCKTGDTNTKRVKVEQEIEPQVVAVEVEAAPLLLIIL